MKTTSQNRDMIAGIGSPHGDDQAGWLVVDRLLRLQCPPDLDPFPSRSLGMSKNFDIHQLSTPIDLLDKIEQRDCLICIDAIEGDEPPGTIKRHLWPFETSWHLHNQSTHGMDLVTVLKVAESIGLLPAKVVLWTIEGTNWEPGAEMNESVKNKLTELVSCVKQESAGWVSTKRDSSEARL